MEFKIENKEQFKKYIMQKIVEAFEKDSVISKKLNYYNNDLIGILDQKPLLKFIVNLKLSTEKTDEIKFLFKNYQEKFYEYLKRISSYINKNKVVIEISSENEFEELEFECYILFNSEKSKSVKEGYKIAKTVENAVKKFIANQFETLSFSVRPRKYTYYGIIFVDKNVIENVVNRIYSILRKWSGIEKIEESEKEKVEVEELKEISDEEFISKLEESEQEEQKEVEKTVEKVEVEKEREVEKTVESSELKEIIQKEVQQSVEKVEFEKEKQKVTKEDLIEIYVLGFELPSYGLAILAKDYEIDYNNKLLKEITLIENDLKRRIESLRRSFYRECEKMFETSILGWITLSKEGIKFAEEWNKRFANELVNFANFIMNKAKQISDQKLQKLYEILANKLILRSRQKIVKCIKVYLDVETAKELLSEIVTKINSEVERLKKEIEELEKKKEEKEVKRRLYELNAKLSILSTKLFMFNEKLRSIS